MADKAAKKISGKFAVLAPKLGKLPPAIPRPKSSPDIQNDSKGEISSTHCNPPRITYDLLCTTICIHGYMLLWIGKIASLPCTLMSSAQ